MRSYSALSNSGNNMGFSPNDLEKIIGLDASY